MKLIKEKTRIYIEDNNKTVGEITFKEISKNLYDINHTYVDKKYRNQGIAKLLLEEVVKELKNNNYKITASCEYAKKYIKK